VPVPEKFVVVCINKRDAEHPRPSCIGNGADDVFNALREEQGRRLNTSVKIVAAGCLEGCMVGPVVSVYPDNVIYGGVTEADVPAIMDHLEGGEPVDMLRIGDAEFELKPPEMENRPPPTA
jgi:(2Fe-2S) ferredoxin